MSLAANSKLHIAACKFNWECCASSLVHVVAASKHFRLLIGNSCAEVELELYKLYVESENFFEVLKQLLNFLSEGFKIVQTVFEKRRSEMSKKLLVIAEIDVTSVKVVQSSRSGPSHVRR
jgi:hypothetical protein